MTADDAVLVCPRSAEVTGCARWLPLDGSAPPAGEVAQLGFFSTSHQDRPGGAAILLTREFWDFALWRLLRATTYDPGIAFDGVSVPSPWPRTQFIWDRCVLLSPDVLAELVPNLIVEVDGRHSTAGATLPGVAWPFVCRMGEAMPLTVSTQPEGMAFVQGALGPYWYTPEAPDPTADPRIVAYFPVETLRAVARITQAPPSPAPTDPLALTSPPPELVVPVPAAPDGARPQLPAKKLRRVMSMPEGARPDPLAEAEAELAAHGLVLTGSAGPGRPSEP